MKTTNHWVKPDLWVSPSETHQFFSIRKMRKSTMLISLFVIIIFPILGVRASEQMELISVETENFERVRSVSESEVCKNTKSEMFTKVVGTFNGEHRLKIRENSQPVVLPRDGHELLSNVINYITNYMFNILF